MYRKSPCINSTCTSERLHTDTRARNSYLIYFIGMNWRRLGWQQDRHADARYIASKLEFLLIEASILKVSFYGSHNPKNSQNKFYLINKNSNTEMLKKSIVEMKSWIKDSY